MRRLEKDESRERFKEVRSLWNEWDPIGVASLVDDEYDSYLGPTLRLLEENASIEKIEKYLSLVVGEHMALDLKYRDCAGFAHKLQAWYLERWPETIS